MKKTDKPHKSRPELLFDAKGNQVTIQQSHVYLPIKTYERILKEVATYKAIIKKDPTARWVKVIVNPDTKPRGHKKVKDA